MHHGSLGFCSRRSVYRGELCVVESGRAESHRGVRLASGVIYYIKELDRVQDSEPVGQVQEVSFSSLLLS